MSSRKARRPLAWRGRQAPKGTFLQIPIALVERISGLSQRGAGGVLGDGAAMGRGSAHAAAAGGLRVPHGHEPGGDVGGRDRRLMREALSQAGRLIAFRGALHTRGVWSIMVCVGGPRDRRAPGLVTNDDAEEACRLYEKRFRIATFSQTRQAGFLFIRP